MHRSSIVLLALTAVAGCASSPESFRIQTPQATEDTYSCVLREVNNLGFTVANADRDAGFVTAEKQASGLGTAILTGKKYFDQMTASIFEASEGETTIRVTVARAEQSAVGFGNMSRTEGNKPTDEGRAAAHALLRACGEGEVVSDQANAIYESRSARAE